MRTTIKHGAFRALVLAALAILLDAARSTPPEADAFLLTGALVVAFPEGACRLVVPYDPIEYRIITGRWSPPPDWPVETGDFVWR